MGVSTRAEGNFACCTFFINGYSKEVSCNSISQELGRVHTILPCCHHCPHLQRQSTRTAVWLLFGPRGNACTSGEDRDCLATCYERVAWTLRVEWSIRKVARQVWWIVPQAGQQRLATQNWCFVPGRPGMHDLIAALHPAQAASRG
jgi:hypothetical protein